ncbi:hypothetical protein ACFQH6_19415 [Halobacteriaceae archaeon GCM10025711]
MAQSRKRARGDVLYSNRRKLRDLGEDEPGVSLPRPTLKRLGLLDENGVPDDHEVHVTIFDDGRIVTELRPE